MAHSAFAICNNVNPGPLPQFTHYYYDAQGRLLGALSNAHEQRTSQIDPADNPSYLHVFPNASRTAQNGVPTNGALLADQYLTSPNGQFIFIIQEDGNAVVCQGTTALWQTKTAGNQPGWLTVDANGNLIFYGPDDSTLWKANVQNGTGANAQLNMQDDGNLVLTENGVPVWSSGAGGNN